ncbi:ClpP family protease [Streptomyces sp. CC77]|uniref:ClpP family protease n=1 Tax=Streptomyces sp. CC77 TaxID=1906739 RepID=UPI0008DD9C08|nr:ATP-dependent Clp protease proteolytic subunit [Streptomyces sp. CC77]OII68375.1 ATP-dependent Clp protease proteolytic subunit [Streptomyces sp. CC77]
MSRRAGEARPLDPHDRLPGARIVLLGTPLDDAAAQDAIARFVHLEHAAPTEDIALYVNSPGGPTAMTAVHDAMQTLTCDAATLCVGRAASTAAVLLAAGAPGKRHALPGARVVRRHPSLEGPLHGRPVDPDAHARELLSRREQMAGLLARHTGREPDRVRADLARDLVLDATGAQAHGIVDEVLAARGEADR